MGCVMRYSKTCLGSEREGCCIEVLQLIGTTENYQTYNKSVPKRFVSIKTFRYL